MTTLASRIVGRATGRIAALGYRLAKRLSGIADESPFVRFLRTELPTDPFIIDVGANVGQFSESLYRQKPDARVFAIEPLPRNVVECRAKFAGKAFEVEQCALGRASASEVEMHVHPYSQASSVLPVSRGAKEAFRSLDRGTDRALVPLYSLDDLLQVHGIARPVDLLKIDVEGYEAEVLRGASDTLSKTSWLLVETQVRRMNDGAALFDEVCHVARAAGFEFQHVVAELDDVFGNLLLMDLLFRNAASTASKGR